MQLVLRNTIKLLLFIALLSGSSILANQNADSLLKNERLYFETDNVEASDQVIRDELKDKFAIISEDEINRIILSKEITQPFGINTNDTLNSSASQVMYKVSFTVPENYLADSTKISWELNIPSFESKLYQLYNGRKIYIDTWPNVIGTINDKTYAGEFEAYKVRNYPFYKDPDPSKASLPPTKPGPGNPLGLFVVHYDENSLRYFHGTNRNSLLNSKMRNLSHGCVRNDNDNIQKMKEFLIKRVIRSKDLTDWLNSKRTLVYELEETDKFPVRITYKTFDMNKDDGGKFIILFKDIYNYSKGKMNTQLNDPAMVTLTNKENLISEYRTKFGNDIPDDALNIIVDYLISNGEEYEKYYVEDLKTKFMLN
ncbi:MAG: L,D-transpeptidase family protein [bacterium]